MLVGALAVSCSPQSATVGTMSVRRYLFCMDCPFALVLKIESCATGTYEPCQGRKAAALSKHSCVPQGSLVGANKGGNAWKAISNTDARILYKKMRAKHRSFLFAYKFGVLSEIRGTFLYVKSSP